MHIPIILYACSAHAQNCQGPGLDTIALGRELRSSEKRGCRWSKGKGTWLDTEGYGFKSHSALKLFLLYIYLLLEKYLII